jgi:hypothetical protein
MLFFEWRISYFYFFEAHVFIFSFTIPPAIRCIHAQKRGMPLLSGLEIAFFVFKTVYNLKMSLLLGSFLL